MATRTAGRSREERHGKDDLLATFGANLKAARLKMGLTQTQLAEATGLLQQYISLVESGRHVTLTTAQVLVTAGNRDVRALLVGPIRAGLAGAASGHRS